eukprot:555880_1
MSDTISTDIVIALALSIFGGIVQSIGYVAQKKAHYDCNHEENEGADIWYAKKLSWKIGITIFSLGTTLEAISLNFGPQCMLIPLILALPLVWITLFSCCVFNETMIFEDFLAILIIFFGSVMVIMFGPNLSSISGQITINDLRIFYTNIFFILFATCLTIAIIMTIIAVKYSEHKNYKSSNNRNIQFGAHFLLFSYCIVGAYFASVQQMFLKSIMSLLGSSIESIENLQINGSDFLTYLLIIFYITTMLFMELFRNRGLAYFGALYVLPIFEVWTLILSSCIGAIYFQELQYIEPFQGTLFFIGIIILSIGVIILAWDVGKILENIADYIAVAFVDENKVGYHHTKGLVYGGFIPKLYQEWYFHRKTFFYNDKFASYFSLSTDDINNLNNHTNDMDIDNEYNDSDDDLHISDVHPLPTHQSN